MLSALAMLISCSTGATLRTARILDKGEFEGSAGAAGTEFGNVSQVVIGAYGVTEHVEIEARYEDHFVAITPRLQLLRSETSAVDCLTFFELSYFDHHLQGGGGIMIGKRWTYFEPYTSYRFRYEGSPIHYVKFGSRIYLPSLCNSPDAHPSNWFIGLEMGPTIIGKGALFEWAANIGYKY